MRTIPTEAGPFRERPYYLKAEIERIATDELRSVDLLPDSPRPIRIERFVEKRFQVTPRYDDLPGGVLGYTEFGAGDVKAIIVARSLAEDESRSSERRINTTLAHEAGHCLLHAHLFAFDEKPKSLFGDDESCGPKVLCRDVDGVRRSLGYDGRWWEYQANLMIGALLLPKHLVEQALHDMLTAVGRLGRRVLGEENRDEAAQVLAPKFEVNPVVATIRVDELYPVGSSKQMSL